MAYLRQQTALLLIKVLEQGHSLQTILPTALEKIEAKQQGLFQQLCYGVLRWRLWLEALASKLLKKPLKNKDKDVYYILLIGLYQIAFLNIPIHSVVNMSVEATKHLNKAWAAGLVNACLRNFSREKQSIIQQLEQDFSQDILYSYPKWLFEQIKNDWPEHYLAILQAGNQLPPLTLRINQKQYTAKEYHEILKAQNIETDLHPYAKHALVLKQGLAIEKLPYFAQGAFSIQDAAAQLAVSLLDLKPHLRILDACAAPGGKTGHIWESAQESDITAIDIDASRVKRLEENMSRLKADDIILKVADIEQIDTWWDGQYFQRILLDVPCSATGVIRRHPDIKWLRWEKDIAMLVKTQQNILQKAWKILAKEGILLYVSCSILKQENVQNIAYFLQNTQDATELKIDAAWGYACPYGRQIFPGELDMDGFYYAKLYKKPDS